MRRFLHDTVVMTRRSLLLMARTPQVVIFASIQPMLFVLLFRYVFGGSIRVPGYGSYVDYLIPGIIVQTTLFGGSSVAVAAARDLSYGVTDRFRSLPMSRAAILTGRTIAYVVRNLLTLSLVTLVGMVVGFRFHTSIPHIVLAVGVALLFGYAFSWFFTLIGLLVRDAEAAQIVGFLPIFPLVFAASTFASPRTMPPWLRWFAEHQPVTYVADAIRALTQGVVPATSPALHAVAWSAGVMLVSGVLAVRRFRTM